MQLIHGDCLEKMRDIPDDSIPCVVTDPPYGISFKSNKQMGDTRNGKEVKVRDSGYFKKIEGDQFLPTEWI